MSESPSPEFLERLTDMDPEIVEGGESAFDDEDFEDPDETTEDE